MATSLETQLQIHVEVLHRTIREQMWSLPKVEAKLGWERGTLAAMFRDPTLLLYGEIFQILDAIDVEPGVYFMDVACRLHSLNSPIPPLKVPFREELRQRLAMVERKLEKLEKKNS